MIAKPSDWNNISTESGRKLPMGGYVCIVHDVIDHADKQYLEIQFDICEGEYKNIGVEGYEKWGNWGFKFLLFYKSDRGSWQLAPLKKFITACEQTNPGFQFDWSNPKCLVKKGFGAVIGVRKYWGTDRQTGQAVLREGIDVQDYCTASDMREGKMPSQPKVKEPKGDKPATAAGVPTYNQTPAFSDDDGELPF